MYDKLMELFKDDIEAARAEGEAKGRAEGEAKGEEARKKLEAKVKKT